jgi:heme-degrading monooxygenase HmoA
MADIGKDYSSIIWQAKKGQEKNFISTFQKFAASAHKQGLIEATLLQEVDKPNNLVSFGLWKNAEAPKKWIDSPEGKDYMAKFKELCNNIQIKLLKSVVKVK